MQMTDNHEKNVKLREENADLAGKLKKFIEQHELREQVFADWLQPLFLTTNWSNWIHLNPRSLVMSQKYITLNYLHLKPYKK